MLNVVEKRAVLLIDGPPVGAVHLRVVEELALNSPGLAEDLRPFSSRVNQRFHLRDIKSTVADLDRAIRRNDPPAVAATGSLIEQLLSVFRERVCADAFKKRGRRALLKL